MTRDEMIVLAKTIAASHGLDPALVCSVCHHESNDWKTWASRYEPGFYAKYVENNVDVKTFGPTCSIGTERVLRATSFGLMQVMGQVARERGFKGEYLTELCLPEIGIENGCLELARRLKNAGGDVRKGLLGFNGGANPGYPDLVLAYYDQYK
jgi:soluble lytic murein transglycosylase-like protein